MEVFDKTWYKELEYPGTFYTNVTALKLLDHLSKFCLGLHTVNAMDIPQLIKTINSSMRLRRRSKIPNVQNSKYKTIKFTLWH